MVAVETGGTATVENRGTGILPPGSMTGTSLVGAAGGVVVGVADVQTLSGGMLMICFWVGAEPQEKKSTM